MEKSSKSSKSSKNGEIFNGEKVVEDFFAFSGNIQPHWISELKMTKTIEKEKNDKTRSATCQLFRKKCGGTER